MLRLGFYRAGLLVVVVVVAALVLWYLPERHLAGSFSLTLLGLALGSYLLTWSRAHWPELLAALPLVAGLLLAGESVYHRDRFRPLQKVGIWVLVVGSAALFGLLARA